MASRFQPKIRRARFHVQGFQPHQMLAIAQPVRDSVYARIRHGLDVNDAPAPPLSMRYREHWNNGKLTSLGADRGYRSQKLKRGLKPIRDWFFTGRTLGCMKVLAAAVNKATIGFTTASLGPKQTKQPGEIAGINNARSKQFGVSGTDRNVLVNAVRGQKFIGVKES